MTERVAMLGTGAMGSRMAARLVAAGVPVTVWNRTRERAEAIDGVEVAATPCAAAQAASVVLSMVRDDDASRDVWLDPTQGALAGLDGDALGVECSTLSLPWVSELAGAFATAGHALVDAPLAGSRPQAEAGKLIFVLGGEEGACERLTPVLAPMAGAVHRVGSTGAGATLKLMINAMLATQLSAMAELIGFSRRAGIDPSLAVQIIGDTPVCSPAAKVSAQAMVAGAWAPAFPIDLVAKDLVLLARSAQAYDAQVPMAERAGDVYARGLAQGLGGDNITGIVQLYDDGVVSKGADIPQEAREEHG